MKIKGYSSKDIADYFNKRKVETPSQYLKIKGTKTTKVWTSSIIQRILCREVYLGHCVRRMTQKISYKTKKRLYINRKEQIIIKNTHEAIISEEMFLAAHDESKYGKNQKNANKIELRFTDFMYCDCCGKKIGKRRSRNYINIMCPNKDEANILCENKTLFKYEGIESRIIKSIQENFDKYLKQNNVNTGLIKKYNDLKIKELSLHIKDLDKEIQKVTFKISRIYNDRLSELIDEESYKKMYSEYVKQRNKLNEDKIKIQEEIEKLDNQTTRSRKQKKLKNILKNIDKDTFSNDEIAELIDRINVGPTYIHIFFNFEEIDLGYHSLL